MAINTYNVGDLVRVTGVFTNVDGDLIDPTTVAIKATDPSGNTDTFTYEDSPTIVVRDSTGTYYYDVDADEPGDWHYTWVSTGDGQSTQIGEFIVEPLPY